MITGLEQNEIEVLNFFELLCGCYYVVRLNIDRDADFADRERSGRNRYTDDDEDERYSTGYRDRRYDDRERRYDDRERRYEDRDRERDRERDRDHRSGYDYDLDRSGYGDRGAERDRGRDSRRRESRRYVKPAGDFSMVDLFVWIIVAFLVLASIFL